MIKSIYPKKGKKVLCALSQMGKKKFFLSSQLTHTAPFLTIVNFEIKNAEYYIWILYKMFACPLCNEWLYVSALCNKCEETKKIVACYGIDKVNIALTSFFLREDDKIDNKVKSEIITRSKKHKGIKGLDGSFEEKKIIKST